MLNQVAVELIMLTLQEGLQFNSVNIINASIVWQHICENKGA